LEYTVRLDENPRRAHINYACPCGCTAGVLYDRAGVFSEVGQCCCGRKMWAGDDAEAHIHEYLAENVEYAWDMGEVTLPWGDRIATALAVPVSELDVAIPGPSGEHGHEHSHHNDVSEVGASMDRVRDVVCGMMVDPSTAAGSSTYRGETYYFCSIGCKTLFDGKPGQFLSSNKGRGLLSRLFRR